MLSFQLIFLVAVFTSLEAITAENSAPLLRGADEHQAVEHKRRLSTPSGWSRIISSSGLCLGITDGSKSKWTSLQPEECSTGSESQMFEFHERDDDAYEIKVQHSSQCLCISKNAKDLRVIEQRPCPRRKSDLTLWEVVNGAGGGHQIRSLHSGKCFTIHEGKIFQTECDDSNDRQIFSFSGSKNDDDDDDLLDDGDDLFDDDDDLLDDGDDGFDKAL